MKIKYAFIALLTATLIPFDGYAAVRKSKNTKCDVALTQAKPTADTSLKSGILMHGEHWVDLILRQAGTDDPRPLKVFEETLSQLLTAIHTGQLDQLNEKVDGSPSMVFGFDSKGKAFVAYKGHFTKKAQALVRSPEEAELHFKRSEALKNIFAVLFAAAKDPLNKVKRKFKNYIFQGDLLFVKGDERRQVTEDAVTIQANAVAYRINKDHDFYEPLKNAEAGVVFHTIGERIVEKDGRVSVKALMDTDKEEKLVREFAKAINDTKIFSMHPWREKVKIGSAAEMSPQQLATEVGTRRILIRQQLENLSAEFRTSWRTDFEIKWRTFFNSGLRPPFDGGFYKEAAIGNPVNTRHWITQFSYWLKGRQEDKLAEKFEIFYAEYEKELSGLIEAYAAAVAIQYKIQPFLKEAYVSKLGGGTVEGLILKTEDSIVKWVDRLEFTLLNNATWNRGGQQASVQDLSLLPSPFNDWKANSPFVVMKVQPIHTGHIQMIREATANNPNQKVYIIASDKEADLAAKEWRHLKATETKKDLQNQNYTYVFSQKFRKQLLAEGLKGIDAEVVMINPGYFWSYLRTAKALDLPGKIKLVVGEKEITEGRYALQVQELGSHFELQAIALKENGLSATQVREALKAAAIGDKSEKPQAMLVLDKAFSYLPRLARKRAIKEAIKQWNQLDEVAQTLIHIHR